MIRTTTLADLRTRGPALFAEAAAETNIAGNVQWCHLERLEAIGWLVLHAVEVDDNLVGYCCAAIAPEFWDDDATLTTLSLYVLPEYRARCWLPLLRALRQSAHELRVGLRIQAIPGTRFAQLLERMGFMPTVVAFDAPFWQDMRNGSRVGDHQRAGPRIRRLRGRGAAVGGPEGYAPAADRPA